MPTVTVVIPFFNRERLLSRAVESVLAQGSTDWEMVLVDDGSTDTSLQVARKLAAGDERISVVHQENAGTGPARNRGIEEASGDFIAILDSDDEWAPEFLDRVTRGLDQCREVDWLYVNARRVHEDGEVIWPSVFDGPRSADFRALSVRRCGDVRILDDPGTLPTAIRSTIKVGANSVVRRAVFERLSYPPGIGTGQDRVLTIAALVTGFRFAYLEDVLLTVYHHDANATGGSEAPERHAKLLAGLVDVYEYVDRHIPLEGEARAALRERLGDTYFEYAVALYGVERSIARPLFFAFRSIVARPKDNRGVAAVRRKLSRS